MENREDTPAATADHAQQAEPGATPAPAPAAPVADSPPEPETTGDQATAAPVPAVPVWTDPPDVTAEARAYYWELERQLGRRQRQLEVILRSDEYHDNPVNLERAETIRILRREIEVLDAAWGYPPFTIKDWENLPLSLPGVQDEEEASPDEVTPDPGVGERRRLLVLKIIRDLGLNHLAISQPPGTSGDKAAVRAVYMEGYRARRQAHAAALKAFDNAWDQLRRDGRIKEEDHPKH